MLKQVCCEGVSKGMSMRMLKDSTPRSAFSRISNVLLSSQKALEKLGLQPDEVIQLLYCRNLLFCHMNSYEMVSDIYYTFRCKKYQFRVEYFYNL